MTDSDETTGPVGLNKTRIVAASLTTGGILVVVLTLLWALARYAQLSRADEFSAIDFFETTALLFLGAAVWLLLWGLAELLRKLDSLLEAQRKAGSASAADATLYGMPYRGEGSSRAADDLRAVLQDLVGLTREVRDISLLSESERAKRIQVQGQALAQQLEKEIPKLLQEHKWVDARERVQQARERFPMFSEWDNLEKQVEAVRASVEARDVQNARRQVDDLTALGAWERAMGVVRELLDRHPNSAETQELARRVTVQREKVNAEMRARLMVQAQEAVNRRDWNEALSLANDLIRRFAKSPEAEALRQQLPTLTENAEIQTRQRMEAQFRELVKRQRFEEALRLAREVIGRYPHSPQADVLREQLARLKERVAAK